jgi:hypothetical protein
MHVIGPVLNEAVNPSVRCLVCPVCDRDDPFLGKFVDEVNGDKVCTLEWITGQYLSNTDGHCDCFESDPFPPEQFPQKRMNQRRYFHYQMIPKQLGVVGFRNRAELPHCVMEKILSLYSDEEGDEYKVGFIAGESVNDA